MKIKVRRGGFTLPEVLVTVTVVAVLAAVVVPAVTQFASKGDAPSVQTDVNALRSAVTSYITDKKTNPTKLSDLAPYASALTFGSTATTATTTLADAYSLVLKNDISAQPLYNGTKYITVDVSSSSGTCDAIDKAIDGSSDATNGSFYYTGLSTDNPCTTGHIRLMPTQ